MSHLILLRHGESVWNASDKIAGLIDVDLSAHGRLQAQIAAKQLRELHIDRIFTSCLKRAMQTSEEIQTVLGGHIPITQNDALNERDFGIYSGHYKSQLKSDLGLAAYEASLKYWKSSPPNGETLKQVSLRAVSFLTDTLEPLLTHNQSILVVSHHHTLKTFVQHLGNTDLKVIGDIKIVNAVPLIFDFDCYTKTYTLLS